MNIRLYNPTDFEPVTLLWRQAREVSLPDFQIEKGHTFKEDQWYFSTHILTENQVWVLTIKDVTAAFMAIKDDFIDCLYVHPDHWRQGLGTALIEFARHLSPDHLWLYTLQINLNARSFYEKNGFVIQKFGISPPPENEPDVEYHWYRPTS